MLNVTCHLTRCGLEEYRKTEIWHDPTTANLKIMKKTEVINMKQKKNIMSLLFIKSKKT